MRVRSVTKLSISAESGNGQLSNHNLMASHNHYLKHSNIIPIVKVGTRESLPMPQTIVVTTVEEQQQHSGLSLKQPTLSHQQHGGFHHPYYHPTGASLASTVVPAQSHIYLQTHSHNGHALPVHALNQNSNFSAASSSTGGGTASSHAPTQQSNTTNSSFSPPSTSRRSKPHDTHAISNHSCVACVAAVQIVRANGVNRTTKKLKTEPILTQFHQTERLNFASTHIVWSEEHWRSVVFQDERKFNLDGPDGFSYYFHDLRNYERTLSQRPRGNSVYIYILITAGGPIHLEASIAKQKPETFMATILRERANIVNKLGGNMDFILQDHNWAANALSSTQKCLSIENIKTQKWPTVSHDLNIMENVWGWLIREVYDGGRKFSRKDDLIFRIREAWARLPVDLLSNLYSTLPERITEVYYTQGIYTNC